MIESNKLLYNLENVIVGKPITADLFLTNYCNNKCKYCTYNRWNIDRSKRKYVTYDEFVRNVEILKNMGVKSVILTGGGEPMLNPDFEKITAYLDEIQMPYGINTNFNILKKCNPTYLKVSLDVGNKKDYKEIRGVDTFENVIRNIQKFAKIKTDKTKLGVQCVVNNLEDIYKFYALAKNLDVDYIVFRPIESTSGKFYKEDKNKSISQIAIKILKGLQELDDRIKINYKWYELDTTFMKCHGNCLQIALDEKSNVIYCCHKPTEIIGHITDLDILEKRKNFITDVSKCDVPCRMTGPNKVMKMLEKVPNDKDFI